MFKLCARTKVVETLAKEPTDDIVGMDKIGVDKIGVDKIRVDKIGNKYDYLLSKKKRVQNIKYSLQSKPYVDTNRLYYLGYIDMTYCNLFHFLGIPNEIKHYKGRALIWVWYIIFEDGLIASISNWIDESNYLQKRNIRLNRIFKWKICGSSEKILDRLILMFL